jgi:dipeptidyl-peptidase-4
MDGKPLHRISAGDWPIDAVLALDEKADRVYVSAPGPDPLEKHAYAFPLGAPGAGVRLTAQPGFHEPVMSRDARYLIDTWSDPTHPPEARLLDRKGVQLAVLQSNALDDRHPYAPYRGLHQAPKYGTVKSVDGQVLHYGYVTPPGFDPTRRHPVILRYYGGPGRQFLTKAWTSGINTGFSDLLTQYWAQQGYIVFSLDNRGTPRRDVAFGHAIHRRLGKAEIEDQLAGVDWLVQQPFVDPKRIGAYGWSYGGYQTLMLLGQASDRVAAGVAVAPVTDLALYDTHYTERYLELPTTNADGYAKTNVLSHLEGLRSPLLLVHGMADDNVLFQHSTLLMAELQKRGIPFELMLYPGAKHGILGQANRTHVYSTIDAFLRRQLKPGT